MHTFDVCGACQQQQNLALGEKKKKSKFVGTQNAGGGSFTRAISDCDFTARFVRFLSTYLIPKEKLDLRNIVKW